MKCIADLFKKREEVSTAIDEVNDITQNKKQDKEDMKELLTGIVDLLLPHTFENKYIRNIHLTSIVNNLNQLISSGKMNRDLELEDIQAEISKKLITLKQDEISKIKKETNIQVAILPNTPAIIEDITFKLYAERSSSHRAIYGHDSIGKFNSFITSLRIGQYKDVIDEYISLYNLTNISDMKITFDNYTEFKQNSKATNNYDIFFFLEDVTRHLSRYYSVIESGHGFDNNVTQKTITDNYLQFAYNRCIGKLSYFDLSDAMRLNLLHCVIDVYSRVNDGNNIRILRTFIGMDKDDLVIFYNKLVDASNEKGLTYPQSFYYLLTNEEEQV